VILAAYDAKGKLLQMKPFVQALGANSEVVISPSIALDNGVSECKFFVWKDGYLPLTAITSVDQLP
jgi:hypothetical protein